MALFTLPWLLRPQSVWKFGQRPTTPLTYQTPTISMEIYQIEARKRAGLIPVGKQAGGKLEWLGQQGNFHRAERYEKFFEEHGRFPEDRDGLREVEPGVWI